MKNYNIFFIYYIIKIILFSLIIIKKKIKKVKLKKLNIEYFFNLKQYNN